MAIQDPTLPTVTLPPVTPAPVNTNTIGQKAPTGMEYGANGALQPAPYIGTNPDSLPGSVPVAQNTNIPDAPNGLKATDAFNAGMTFKNGTWFYPGQVTPNTYQTGSNTLTVGSTNPTGITSPSGSYSSFTPDNKSTLDTATASRQAVLDQAYNLAQETVTKINNLQNGTTPLTAGQQAQVDALRQKYEDSIAQQKLMNTGASGNASIRGYQSGAAEYDPTFQAKTINSIVSAGIQKVNQWQTEEASAIAKLTQAFRDNDIKVASDTYKMLQDAYKNKSDALNETIKNAQAAIDKANKAANQSQIDAAIAKEYTSGNINPAQILSNVTKQGVNATSKDLKDFLDTLAVKTGGTTAQVTNGTEAFYNLKNKTGGLPMDILALPDTSSQLFEFLKRYNSAMSSGTASGKAQYPTQKTSQTGKSGSTVSYEIGADPVVDSHIQNVLNGNETMQQVPATLRNAVSLGLTMQGKDSYSPLAASRFTTASNKITSPYRDMSAYKLTADGLPYLERIDAAIKTPGSVSDQDLLDSLTKLNTGGNAITDAQVRLITDGKSFSDSINTWKNKFQNGGVLSNDQRNQIQQIAKSIYENYKKGYQPIYEKAVKQLKSSGIPEAFWTIPDLNNLSKEAETSLGLGSSGANDFINNPPPGTNTNSSSTYDPNVWAKIK